MHSKIDYEELSKHAIAALKEINKLAKEFSKYEMVSVVKDEMDEILDLSSGKTMRILLGYKRRKESNAKESYADFITNIIQIEDDIAEIEFLTSDMMKKVYDLGDEEKNEFFESIGIDPIAKEDVGISKERHALLDKMAEICGKLTSESEKFYSEELEDYVDIR